MHYSALVFSILIFKNDINAEVTAEQYASLPELFHQDNFDNCMLRGDEAFYCSFVYEIEPIDKENPPDAWAIIKNVSDVVTNYRHDHLRRWICVPKTCPGINKTNDNDPLLKKSLEDCYDKEYEELGLKGTITKIECLTLDSKYPFDWLDVLAGMLFVGYIAFVMYATIYEGIARYKPPEEYEKRMNTKIGGIYKACSITRNWIRLKTISSTPEIEKLRCIQGIRVYNTGLVILCHTLLGFVAAPTANTRYLETMHEKNGRLFFSSGPLCVTTFFFIGTFLLSNGLFDYLKEKKMNLKTILVIIANRFFRLTPTVFVVVLFHATLLRHLGNGPNWNQFIATEYLKCRKNWWNNVLFINNWVDPYNMCLPVTWYLAVDTQIFIFSLFFIWLIKVYEKYVWYIVGSAVTLNVVATFIHNYSHDFTALVMPTPEIYYHMSQLISSHQFHKQLCGPIGNSAGPIVGIAFGYYFFKHKNDEKPHLFNTEFRRGLYWVLTFGIGLSFVIVPGLIILRHSAEHDAFWASVYVAVSRPLFACVIGIGIIGYTEGVGWLALRVCQWRPTYILGRLSFSAYLIHMSVVLTRPALARNPIYISDFQILVGFVGDWSLIYISATLLTLFLELPVSELQKYVFGQKEPKPEKEDKLATEHKDK